MQSDPMPPSSPYVFFDAGNVLVSDDPSGCHVLRALYHHLTLHALRQGMVPESISSFFERRTQWTLNGGFLWGFVAEHKTALPNEDVRAFQLQVRRAMYRTGHWAALSPPIPGMAEVLFALRSAGYRLGLIANQPPTISHVLNQRGLNGIFETMAISDVVGISKPDPGLFEYALKKAGIDPEEAVMVGDRIDNDIVPAKKIGMRTAWINLPTPARGWYPETEFSKAYLQSVTVASVSQRPPAEADEVPDVQANTPRELLEGLLKLLKS
jgi:HAD superfamily hydrolase (TIGR01509 family)